MTSISEKIAKCFEFDEQRDGVQIVRAAEKESAEYFEPKTKWTVWGDKKECYEHGFYSGALYQRNRTEPLVSALCSLVEALEHIRQNKGMTNLGKCCVDKTCQQVYDDGELIAHCSFQYGVARGFNKGAAMADEALATPHAALEKMEGDRD